MKKKVLETINNYGLLSRGDRCILAVSGGADSMALLHMLSSLKTDLGIELRAVHVHHGLRGAEADRDALWVKKSCDSLGIACEIKYVDVKAYVRETGTSTEEAARILRYGVLFDAANAWDAKIAVAHNLNDNAETILMQMARGSGLKGLGGIGEKNGRIIRPLLHIKRSEIERYLKDLGVSWVTDSTNLDDEYTRNRIRHRVLPELEKGVNVAAAEHIASAGETVSQAYAYIRGNAEKLIDEHMSADCSDKPREEAAFAGKCRFPVEVLRSQPRIMQSTIIMLLLEKVCATRKDISAVHIDDVLSLMDKENGKYVYLPYGMRARREYESICIERCEERDTAGVSDPSERFSVRIFDYSGQSVPTGEYTKWFDYDKIISSITFRYRKAGDYITLGKTGRKTISSFMTDRKIPTDLRDRIPLVADGDNIMWIVGYRIGETCKITPETKRVVEITYREM